MQAIHDCIDMANDLGRDLGGWGREGEAGEGVVEIPRLVGRGVRHGRWRHGAGGLLFPAGWPRAGELGNFVTPLASVGGGLASM